MRFRPETLGLLARPRILNKAVVLSLNTENQAEFLNSWSRIRRASRIDHAEVFGKSAQDLFAELTLGDTTKDLSKCYVGIVTHYVVKVGHHHHLVDKSNVSETLKKVRKLLGSRTNLRVVSVGLTFYRGLEQSEDGRLAPVRPWSPATASGGEPVWFFNPWEIVPMSEIVRYESVNRGDLILFQKAKGIVVKKKMLNKPKFYNTSSWSCYSLTLLNHLGDGFTRFLPDRAFTVRRSDDPLPQEEDSDESDQSE